MPVNRIKHNLWLIYNAAMEQIVYDKQPIIQPASLPGMAEKTIIVGSVSKKESRFKTVFGSKITALGK